DAQTRRHRVDDIARAGCPIAAGAVADQVVAARRDPAAGAIRRVGRRDRVGSVQVGGDNAVLDGQRPKRIVYPAAVASPVVVAIGRVVGDRHVVQRHGAGVEVDPATAAGGLVARDGAVGQIEPGAAFVAGGVDPATVPVRHGIAV